MLTNFTWVLILNVSLFWTTILANNNNNNGKVSSPGGPSVSSTGSSSAIGADSPVKLTSPWTWTCKNHICVKHNKDNLDEHENGIPLSVCKLNCGKYGQLWPKPTGKIEIGKRLLYFPLNNVKFESFQTQNAKVERLFLEASNIFKGYLNQLKPNSNINNGETDNQAARNNTLSIELESAWADDTITLKTDESYVLSIRLNPDQNGITASIVANTFFGARNGLETLSQLIAYNEETRLYAIVTHALVSDKPVYVYRGLMLDTSRNYFSVDSIKKIIAGMSYVKLNMFHWHITDTHSFPFYSKRQPKLTEYGAYSPSKIYTVEDMQEIVKYATVRGVKVVPEFDQPAHTGNGWQFGPSQGLGDLAVCVNQEPWQTFCVEPPCGQLNVVNENLYPVLGDLYKDFLDIFDHDLFHMGGDEINFNCWNSSSEITDFMLKRGNGLSKEAFVELWGMFQKKAYEKLKEANNGQDLAAILWTSDITSQENLEKYINNSIYIIQIWTEANDKIIPFLLEKDYRVIFSNYDAWYLDCGYGGWVGAGPTNWCSPYKGWQQVYENNPVKIYANFTTMDRASQALQEGKLLGGSVQLWSEQVDEQAAEGKIWPRAAAIAERLWSNPDSPWSDAEYRMVQTRERLVQRGIRADRLQPEWCRQNEMHCYL